MPECYDLILHGEVYWIFWNVFLITSFYFEWLTLTGSLQFFYLALQIFCCGHAEVCSHLNYLLPKPLNLLNDAVLWQTPARKTDNNAYEPKLVHSQSQDRESCKYLLHSFAPYPLLYLCQMDLLQTDLTIKTLRLGLPIKPKIIFQFLLSLFFLLKKLIIFSSFVIFLKDYAFF